MVDPAPDFDEQDSTLATYSAAVQGLVPAASPTDVFTITGSATKTVRISQIQISGLQTTHSYRDVLIVKRSTANTAGTSTAKTSVPHDSTNPAATATVLAYTANPTLGTLVGTMRAIQLGMPLQTPNNAQASGGSLIAYTWKFGDDNQSPTLRGVTQVLAVNLNGVSLSGGILDISVEYTEET